MDDFDVADLPALMTAPQLAKVLAISEKTLARYRLDGRGPRFIRVGRRILYRRESVIEYLAAREYTSTAEARHRGEAA